MTADAELVKATMTDQELVDLCRSFKRGMSSRDPEKYVAGITVATARKLADAIERLMQEAVAWKNAAFLSDNEAHSTQLDEMTERAEAVEANLTKARAALIGIADYWESDPEPSPGTLFDAIEEMQRRARAALKGE